MNAAQMALPPRETSVRGSPPNSWSVVVCGLVVMGIAVRLPTMPLTPDVDDSVFFVRGVIRYSIADMRPHWPGYPVYIWLGKLIAAAVDDPTLGLHLLSALASALTAWPLALVTRSWALSLGVPEATAGRCGWATAALWLVTPMAWVTGGQIVSDPLGLLCGATLLALCVTGADGGPGRWLAAATLAGIMLGVRLVNVTMLGPLLAASWRRRAERWRGIPAPLALLLAGAAGALPWMIWLLARDPWAFVHGAGAHVGGHFTRWGESLWTDHHPLTRPLRALRTLAVYGLGGRLTDWPGLIVSAAWTAVLAMAAAVRPWRGPVSRVVLLWGLPHLLYVFVGHDIEFPRYMLSAVALLTVLTGLVPVRFGHAGLAALAATVAAMMAVSAPLALRQHHQPPTEVRVARFLALRRHPAIAIVDHPGLPFYLEGTEGDVVWAAAAAEEIPRWQQTWAGAGREVFATAPPPQDPGGWVPVAHFCRDPLINPYLSREIWLFAPVSVEPAAGGRGLECDER